MAETKRCAYPQSFATAKTLNDTLDGIIANQDAAASFYLDTKEEPASTARRASRTYCPFGVAVPPPGVGLRSVDLRDLGRDRRAGSANVVRRSRARRCEPSRPRRHSHVVP